jgi:hypothetical protein
MLRTAMPKFLLRHSLAVYLAIAATQSLYMVAFNRDDPRHAGIAGSDGQAYYAFVRSLVIDGDLSFENEFYEYNYNRHGFQTRDFLPRSPHTGLYFNRYGIGYSLVIAPFFLLAHFLTLLGPIVGIWNWAADGYTLLYQFAPPIGAFVYGGLSYSTTRRILRRFVGDAAASAATFVTFMSSPVSYMFIAFWCNPTFPTIVVFNLILLTAFRIEDRRAAAWDWIAIGALAGFGGALRTENVLFALIPLVLALVQWRRLSSPRGFAGSLERLPHSEKATVCATNTQPGAAGPQLSGRLAFECLLAFAAFCVAFFPQILAWRVMWGRWFHVSMNNPGERFNWTHPALWQVLFSTRHGLFYWSPLLFAGFCGWMWMVTRGKRTAAAGTTTLRIATFYAALMYYVYASWSIWWMGYSFGARQFIPFTALFALGLAAIYEWPARGARRKAWLGVLSILSLAFVLWNQAMLYMFVNGHIPRSEGFAPLLPLKKLVELALRLV